MTREILNQKLFALGTDIWHLRGTLNNEDLNYVNDHHELRMKSAQVLSAALLSDAELKKFLIKECFVISEELDQYGLFVEADHIMPRTDKSFFRKNFDYGEGWHDMMEKFREGKIKSVKEWLEQRRKPRKEKKVKSHHVLNRGNIADVGYIIVEEQSGIDLGASPFGYAGLNNEIVKVFSNKEEADRQAEALLKRYERLRNASKKKKEEDEPSYPSPFDSYCDSKQTREYWMKLKEGEGEDAVEDFIDYIKEVKCPKDQFKMASTRRLVVNAVNSTTSVSHLSPHEKVLMFKVPTQQSSVYRHLANSPYRTHGIKVGDPVLFGQTIGVTGGTGRVTGPHLHVELLEKRRQVDPSSYQEKFYPSTPGGYRVTSPFGGRIHPVTKERKKHRGIDIGGVGVGTPVKSMSDGVVEYIGKTPVSGWTIKIRHYEVPQVRAV